jgi:predicted GNAT family acetyltransferase
MGAWRLVFARDEFADHGRPYGGRNGGEGAHQRRQAPRPDYAAQHPASSLRRCELKRPEQASGPEQLQALGASVLADAAADAPVGGAVVAPDFRIVNDEVAGIYDAVIGETTVGGLTYNLIGDDRIVLLAVSVFPEFRRRGIATELIRRVLDDVRAAGRTITNFCPIVATFLDDNPQYADLVDGRHPGVVGHRR